ncbi:sugar phosphate permease [Candidatus Moduliflexus flocculans]|uniref:Sugar phosphate permease n=1 Tax=Candidatus Moduliflexus flocculans TaxID=1499966 RepID=A0A081BS43_9BACT|nr:sugar phosphate permease [Candidatus Moduliflexus flocculans]
MRSFLKKIDNSDLRSGLAYSTWDGILWAVMFGVAENYLVPFALLFTANAFQLSLLQATAFLSTSIGQVIGAHITAKMPSRKFIPVLGVRTQAACWLFIFALTTWTGNAWFIILFYFTSLFVPNLGGPGWLSWMNDLIPQHLRGEYWGMRNRLVGITQLISMGIAGFSLQFAKHHDLEFLTFGILFSLGFLARFIGSFAIVRQYEPPGHHQNNSATPTFATFLTTLPTSNFGRFALFNFCMAFAINIMEPIINIYVLQSLHFGYAEFSVLTTIRMLISFWAMAYWGPLSDRYGNYQILRVTTMMMPLVSLAWLIIKNFYALALIQGFTGFILAGMNLAIQNYQFDSVKRHEITKTMAYFNMFNNLFAFSGALVGGALTHFTPHLSLPWFAHGNYELIFLFSGLLRVATLIIFHARFREVRKVEPSPGMRYFYIYIPVTNVLNRFEAFGDFWGMRNDKSKNHESEQGASKPPTPAERGKVVFPSPSEIEKR